jgi:hypothetical protein
MSKDPVNWVQLFYSAVAFVIAVAGLFAALGVIARSRFGGALRWVIHRIVVDPIGERIHASVSQSIATELEARFGPIMTSLASVEHEVKMNNGSSMRDEVTSIRTTLMNYIGKTTVEVAELHGMVRTLLEHDAERDVAGRRYGRLGEASLIRDSDIVEP